MTVENDEARRAYFLAKLGGKLQNPGFRKEKVDEWVKTGEAAETDSQNSETGRKSWGAG
jgi:hypothetical protein